jgi:Family of unknown function (DUF5906)
MSIELQRALTVEFITRKRLNVPIVFLRPESANPSAEDAVKPPEGLATDLGLWTDDRNLGARLVDGFIELQIKAPDDVWCRCLFSAFHHLRIDGRAAYGAERVSSILLRIEDPGSIDPWHTLWPKGHKDRTGNWIETKFVSSDLPTPKSKPVWRDSRPLPGSVLDGNVVVWRPNAKPPALTAELCLEDLESRPIAATTMPAVVRAIAYATLAYWIQAYLDGLTEWESSLMQMLGGWIARLVVEGHAINAKGKSLEGVCWSPVDDSETAADLIEFLKTLGATNDLGVAYARAAAILERSGLEPVSGWGAIETRFGVQAKVGIRRAFRAGIDLQMIELLAEQYVFDTSSHTYIDREALLKGLTYEHPYDDLVRQYENQSIYVQGKAKNPFRLYSASSLRTDAQRRDFFPGEEPAALLRFSRVHGLLGPEDRKSDDYTVFNTFPGFAIKPIATIDPGTMQTAIGMLDRILGLLTQDNDAQILYLKKFIAHIAKYPAEKPQVCPIIVGGQGIGKSVLGQDLMGALFGEMAGSADAASLSDNKFLITPFLGKLITFIDEVRLESVGAINTIKKLVRADFVSGQVKFGHQRDYYIPSRMLIASNSADIGLSPADAADRAFFFIVAWTAENKRMTEREFQTWAVGLKEFYAAFTSALRKVVFRQHLMRYFTDLEVNREELENLEHSSRNDEMVVRSTMTKDREVARQIVAEAHVLWAQDITAWFNKSFLQLAIKRVEGPRSRVEASQVMLEYERANVLEHMTGDMVRFKWGYGRLCEKLGEAHNLVLHPIWPVSPVGPDWDVNGVSTASGAPTWRGLKHGQKDPGEQRPRSYDPDYMPEF